MEKIKFILPSSEMKPAAAAFHQAFTDCGEEQIAGILSLDTFDNFTDWLDTLRLDPSTTYFVFRLSDNRLIGIVNIQHRLSKYGHISCSVRPDERNKGYGAEILRLALDRAREFGVIDAEVVCPAHNAAARKIIRRNGLEKLDATTYHKIL